MLRYCWQLLKIRSARFLRRCDESEKLVPKNWYAIARVKKNVRRRAQKTFAQKSGGQPGRVSVRVRTGPALCLIPMESGTSLSVPASYSQKNSFRRCKNWSMHHSVALYLSLPEPINNNLCRPSWLTKKISAPNISTSTIDPSNSIAKCCAYQGTINYNKLCGGYPSRKGDSKIIQGSFLPRLII